MPASSQKKTYKLTAPQQRLLQDIAPNNKFSTPPEGHHHRTQQALIDRDLVVSNASGTMIKPTAAGRRLAKSL